MQKKITKHTIGPMYPNIVGICNKIQEKTKKNPKILGIVFSNEGAKGREPLFDVSYSGTKDIFAYWEDQNKGIICISSEQPGYEIRAPKDMKYFFSGVTAVSQIFYLDVAHLDVSNTTDFTMCFAHFGDSRNSQIKGLENWNVQSGRDFSDMFYDTFSKNTKIELDLSNWNFNSINGVNAAEMFAIFGKKAQSIMLNVDNWNVNSVFSFANSFCLFGLEATHVEITGIENWKMHNKMDVSGMFAKFAPNSDWYPNLSKWDMKGILSYKHEEFATGLFFKIREPEWG